MLTREQIIATTLELIDEREGSHGVKFREIARRIGCAHTSLYNYFPTMEALLTDAAIDSVRTMRSTLFSGLQGCSFPDSLLLFTERLYDYAASHIGQYKFLWFEGAIRSLERHGEFPNPERLFLGELAQRMRCEESDQTVIDAGALLQSYVHGELAKLICGAAGAAAEDMRSRILRNTKTILEKVL